jgi:hypothetical protein
MRRGFSERVMIVQAQIAPQPHDAVLETFVHAGLLRREREAARRKQDGVPSLELTAAPLELPLVHTFTIARSSESVARTVLVRLRWGEIDALGESSPSPRYDESVASVIAAGSTSRCTTASRRTSSARCGACWASIRRARP